MAVADIPAEQIVNIRSSYDQFLWQISPMLELYRWDKNVGYMYAYGAVPVPGQGLPPGPPVPNPDAPFSLGELEYLNDFYIRTINGMAPDEQGNVQITTGIDQAARDAASAAQATANRAVPASAATAGQAFIRNAAGNLTGLPYADATTAGALAIRDDAGSVLVPTPTKTGQAAAKGYVDTQVATRVKTVNGTGPDADGNVVVSGGGSGTVQKVNNVSPDGNGNVTLAAADVGAAPTTHTHTASQISNSSTVGRSVLTAADAAAARTAIGAGTGTVKTANGAAPDANGNVVIPKTVETSAAAEVPLCVYGDSIAVGSNASSTSRGWAALLSNANRLASSSYNNYGVSSTVMGDIARAVLTGTISNATRRGLHIIHSGINSIINVTSANDAAEKTGFVTALKANLRILRGSWLLATDTSIVYTGTWTNKSLAGVTHSSPNVKQSDVSGNYFTITTTAAEIAIMLIGFSTASPSDGVPYTITVNGSAYTPEVATTAATTSPNNPWGPQSVRVVNPSPGTSMAVRLTRGAGASFYMDGYVVKDPNPPVVMVCNIIMPTQAGLNVNGSDTNRTPANVTNFNNLIASVVNSAEFSADGLVKLVDISPGFDNATMRTSEAIHPNNIGHKVIAGNLEAAARLLPVSTGLNL